jgi:hypothetical protein
MKDALANYIPHPNPLVEEVFEQVVGKPDGEPKGRSAEFTRIAQALLSEELPGAKAFHLNAVQYEELQELNPFSFQPDTLYFHPPFPIFKIVLDEDLRAVRGNKKLIDVHSTGPILVDSRSSLCWLVVSSSSILSCPVPVGYEATCANAEPNSSALRQVPLIGDSRDQYRHCTFAAFSPNQNKVRHIPTESYGSRLTGQDLEEMAHASYIGSIRALFNFLLLLNNRKVAVLRVADPARPLSRQQRRAAAYVEADHYSIVLQPGSAVSRLIRQSAFGHNVINRRPHDVRSHLRHLKTGGTVPVKAHRRGLTSNRSLGVAEYDATQLRRHGVVRQHEA